MCACQPTDVVYAVKPSLALHSPTVTGCCVRAVQPLGMRFACVRRLLQFAPSQNIAMSAAVHRLTAVGHATQEHRGSLCRATASQSRCLHLQQRCLVSSGDFFYLFFLCWRGTLSNGPNICTSLSATFVLTAPRLACTPSHSPQPATVPLLTECENFG